MRNKTVNDTSYSSNKNDLYKNIIKKITDYFKERKAVSIVSAIIFCAVIVAACFSDISVKTYTFGMSDLRVLFLYTRPNL